MRDLGTVTLDRLHRRCVSRFEIRVLTKRVFKRRPFFDKKRRNQLVTRSYS